MPSQKPWSYLLLFLTNLSLALAACKTHLFPSKNPTNTHIHTAPTSFCKCTCFTNSTLIPLDAPQTPSTVESPNPDVPKGRTCNDCNKQFCLDYHLPICQGAQEDDVFTTCFQRDSRKDQAVVFLFISATGALLGWAGVKPWVQRWRERSEGRGEYVAVDGSGGE
ncbi:hypothetical protein Tdes44962_MAKER03453 [Teratosphaeria destructans]|uniref:Uncharacterized protein n=1 Tax=Teratosphaeria destructans TaxID=418781 RepID=A0A9W7SPQ0_9PEZI|nr:hypothetical protein Tdes44962_MAKER03453 [Teratosphaeria destructans]